MRWIKGFHAQLLRYCYGFRISKRSALERRATLTESVAAVAKRNTLTSQAEKLVRPSGPKCSWRTSEAFLPAESPQPATLTNITTEPAATHGASNPAKR